MEQQGMVCSKFATRDGRKVYNLIEYHHPEKWKIKRNYLKGMAVEGFFYNPYANGLSMGHWDCDGLFCNRDHPELDLVNSEI